MKYVIVGGVAGGATAAARIRRISEDSEIAPSRRAHISYANSGLPYYIGGAIEDRNRLFVQTPEAFGRRFGIDVRVKSEVVGIDRAAKRVVVAGPDGERYHESYDRLLLSPGASPVRPPLPGIGLDGIFTLRDVADTDAIKDHVKTRGVKRAVIVGAGFIGLEMAENLSLRRGRGGCGGDVGPGDGPDRLLHGRHGASAPDTERVRLYLGAAVAAFERGEKGIDVVPGNGDRIQADTAVLSIGVRPNSTLAAEAGLETGETRGIKVNEYTQTSDDDIYAVGDAVEYPHPLTGLGRGSVCSQARPTGRRASWPTTRSGATWRGTKVPSGLR